MASGVPMTGQQCGAPPDCKETAACAYAAAALTSADDRAGMQVVNGDADDNFCGWAVARLRSCS